MTTTTKTFVRILFNGKEIDANWNWFDSENEAIEYWQSMTHQNGDYGIVTITKVFEREALSLGSYDPGVICNEFVHEWYAECDAKGHASKLVPKLFDLCSKNAEVRQLLKNGQMFTPESLLQTLLQYADPDDPKFEIFPPTV